MLGTPSGEDPDASAKIEYWETELDALVDDVDESVAADEYDPDRLAALREQCEQLDQRQEELEETTHTQRHKYVKTLGGSMSASAVSAVSRSSSNVSKRRFPRA
jgi:CBS-domain-containing membrane protein